MSCARCNKSTWYSTRVGTAGATARPRGKGCWAEKAARHRGREERYPAGTETQSGARKEEAQEIKADIANQTIGPTIATTQAMTYDKNPQGGQKQRHLCGTKQVPPAAPVTEVKGRHREWRNERRKGARGVPSIRDTPAGRTDTCQVKPIISQQDPH